VSDQALAGFDVLRIAALQTESSDGMTEGELHTLAYLGCLLSVYDGHPASWWGYRFTATRAGAPFAYSLSQALDLARDAGLLFKGNRVWVISERGLVDLQQIAPLILNQRRQPYLEAASGTALAMPLPSLASALSREPGLQRALNFVRTRELLDETGLALLDDQFQALADALQGDAASNDLMVPAVVWLTYLTRMEMDDEVAA
jgi:hypothetical protein